MSDGFRAVKETGRPMHGPRGVLVCGYAPAEQEALLAMMERRGFGDAPAIFVDAGAAGLALAELLSGLLEKELHAFMAAWKTLGLPSQLWACLTPTSETWTLKALLTELDHERQALAKR